MTRLVAVVAGVALIGSACASRPSTDALAESILDAGVESLTADYDAALATCVADYLLASELSDTTLSGLAQGFDAAEVLSSEVDLVPELVSEATQSCLANSSEAIPEVEQAADEAATPDE